MRFEKNEIINRVLTETIVVFVVHLITNWDTVCSEDYASELELECKNILYVCQWMPGWEWNRLLLCALYYIRP